MRMECDFDGWVTKNDILCTDGRVITRDAFRDDDGCKVPLVFQHSHDDPSNVLGHVYLENRPEGVYGYASFNNTQKAQDTKEIVRHGDLDSLSIYANKLRQNGNRVLHGSIKEVSLVLAGANSGAKIQNLYFEHADGSMDVTDEEAIIYTNMPINFGKKSVDISHADETEKEEKAMPDSNKTVKDVIDSMTEEQKKVMYFMIGEALKNAGGNEAEHSDINDEEENYMKHNAFDAADERTGEYLSHADAESLKSSILSAISSDNRSRNSINSLGDFIQHEAAEYGIQDIDWLFPDARTLQNTPEFIKRDDTWVDIFMNGTKHLPFSRVKVQFADITADEARARGYLEKGHKKLEEVFTLLRRSVAPTTIYKKQKLDRDDILDITDFDVVVWLKTEMRMMLNEEIARAALIGDGRSGASNDKISEEAIIPIWKDDSLFTIPVRVEVTAKNTRDQKAEAILEAIIRARKEYKGSGNLTWFTTEDMLTDILLMKDGIGNRIYKNAAEVAQFVRVNRIVTVPVMENQSRTVTTGEGASAVTETRNLVGIIVDMVDYSFGSDKGGAVSMFDDFDIDFNQYKYLMETRCSGALTKPKSAMAVETVTVANG